MNDTTKEQEPLQIGAFSGFNRRPEPSQTGMTAQFFGENGDDADMISALSLTKFLEADVFMRVHLIKDSSGRIMKGPDGKYPTVASFSGKIMRPKPKRDGMLAQFFAPNGRDADQVNELGKTCYMDAFVFIEVMKPQAAEASPEIVEQSVSSPDLDEVSKHLTPAERRDLSKKAKAFSDANRILKLSGFLRQPMLWERLGGEAEFFSSYLDGFACCAPGGKPCDKPSILHRFDNGSGTGCLGVPLCPEHSAMAEQGAIPGGVQFLGVKQTILVQDWAWEALVKKVPPDHGTDSPDPQKVMLWASENGLDKYIPPNYLAKFK